MCWFVVSLTPEPYFQEGEGVCVVTMGVCGWKGGRLASVNLKSAACERTNGLVEDGVVVILERV